MASNISDLEERIEQVQNALGQIDSNWEPSPAAEDLTGRDLRRAIEVILGDLSRLCRGDHLKFYFSNAEVDQIVGYLSQIVSNIGSPSHIISALNGIRPHVRSYLIRGVNQDRADQIAEVEEKLRSLESYHIERQHLAEERETLGKTLADSASRLEKIDSQIETLEELQTKAEAHELAAKASAESAAEEEAAAENSRVTMDTFIAKIAERETQLENQSAKTEAFEKKIKVLAESYDTDKKARDERLREKEAELDKLIAHARDALELNSALGLSKEFGERAKSLRAGIGVKFRRDWPFLQKDNAALWWIIFAGLFICGALTVTFLMASNLLDVVFRGGSTPLIDPSGGQTDEWFKLFSRLSVVGICVTAAVFCANQYKRNQKLLEDYTYKKVVAASLPAFREKVAGFEDANSLEAVFLKKALDEIFCHPLREDDKTDKDNDPKVDVIPVSVVKALADLLASAAKK